MFTSFVDALHSSYITCKVIEKLCKSSGQMLPEKMYHPNYIERCLLFSLQIVLSQRRIHDTKLLRTAYIQGSEPNLNWSFISGVIASSVTKGKRVVANGELVVHIWSG
jgi:hypothetical protein